MEINLKCIYNAAIGEGFSKGVVLVQLNKIGEGFYYCELHEGTYVINGIRYGFWLKQNRLYFQEMFNNILFVTDFVEKILVVEEIKERLKMHIGFI